MSLHGNVPINLIIINQALLQNRTLGQKITYHFFWYVNNTIATFADFQNPHINHHS
jgi:hypothetical protein